MTSVVLVDTGERVVECIAADEDPQLVSRTETQARGASQLLRALLSPFQPLKSFPGPPSITRRRESVKWTWSPMEML